MSRYESVGRIGGVVIVITGFWFGKPYQLQAARYAAAGQALLQPLVNGLPAIDLTDTANAETTTIRRIGETVEVALNLHDQAGYLTLRSIDLPLDHIWLDAEALTAELGINRLNGELWLRAKPGQLAPVLGRSELAGLRPLGPETFWNLNQACQLGRQLLAQQRRVQGLWLFYTLASLVLGTIFWVCLRLVDTRRK